MRLKGNTMQIIKTAHSLSYLLTTAAFPRDTLLTATGKALFRLLSHQRHRQWKNVSFTAVDSQSRPRWTYRPSGRKGLCLATCHSSSRVTRRLEGFLAPPAAALQVPNGAAGFYLLGRINQLSNRHIAATRMNERSSRSHSVFTATVEAHERTPTGVTHVRFSKLKLIDLAGSERVGRSGATGEQLKEANSINRSLTVLGRVISALVERQKKPAVHVPYRDSVLTFLLKVLLTTAVSTMHPYVHTSFIIVFYIKIILYPSS